MATFDASASDVGFNMNDVVSVDFSSSESLNATNYSYLTDGGDKVHLFGFGMGYTANVPTAGIVTSGQIDLDSDGFANPEITFTVDARSLVAMMNGGNPSNAIAFFDQMLNSTNDTVTGSGFDDTLKGLGGDDTILGGAGADYIVGGDGNDSITPGADEDGSDGGAGADWLDLSTDGSPATIDLTAGTADFAGLYVESHVNYELVVGTTGNDTITGTTGDNDLKGVGGADVIAGGDGSDLIFGGDDNDVINGGKGFDSLFGGEGNDNVKGGAVADLLKGLGGDDTLVGGGGVDSLDGGDGNDEMRGNLGFDDLDGGNGDDVLAGRGGADTLFGADGNDFLTGKGGNDKYVFNMTGDTDTIRSFTPGAGGDFIELSGFGASFDSFAEVMAAMSTDGVNTTITFGGGDVLVVKGVTPGAFDASDFQFI